MTIRAVPGRVHVRAPGKINVFLQVGSVQPDGYHDVATAYQAVSAVEEVWATPADGFTVSVTGSMDVSGVPHDDRNLAVRAARLLAHEIGWRGGVHLDVVKGVPVAGGMGGGSADAAATLVACDALWGAGLGSHDLQELGSRLGADVPFSLMGGTAVGTGRGDVLSPALARGRFDWVIVTDEQGLSTPDVYRALDAHRNRHAVDIAPPRRRPEVATDVLHALRAGDAGMLAESAQNDLQAATLALRPDLTRVLDEGERAGALVGLVSGSGPTLAFLASDAEAAIELQVLMSAAGHRALHVHGPVPGARIID